MGGDQGTFEEAMRVAAQIVAVLEGAGLALVAIDAQVARAGLAADDLPFAAGGEAGAAQAAQAGVIEGGQELDGRTAVRARPDPGRRCDDRAGTRRRRDRPPADGLGQERGEVARGHDRAHGLGGGGLDPALADHGRRRMAAGAHAGCGEHTDRRRVHGGAQLGQESVRAGQRAAQAVADADGDRRRGRLALLHHVEVVVEGGDLVDLGLGEAQLLGQGRDVLGGDVAPAVLDQVEELDQEVAPAWPIAEQRPDSVECLGLDLPAAAGGPPAALALAWMQGPPRRARLLDDR